MQQGDSPLREDVGAYLREIQSEPAFRKWVESLGSLAEAWKRCDRADWMLHLLDNSGQPSPALLRKFCRITAERFSGKLPAKERPIVLDALADFDENLTSEGVPLDTAISGGVRATVEALTELNQAVGNWTTGRVALVALAALDDQPMVAAQGVSEQAGMAAQYINEFPTALDWPEEMARQADLLRELFGNPFEKM